MWVCLLSIVRQSACIMHVNRNYDYNWVFSAKLSVPGSFEQKPCFSTAMMINKLWHMVHAQGCLELFLGIFRTWSSIRIAHCWVLTCWFLHGRSLVVFLVIQIKYFWATSAALSLQCLHVLVHDLTGGFHLCHISKWASHGPCICHIDSFLK